MAAGSMNFVAEGVARAQTSHPASWAGPIKRFISRAGGAAHAMMYRTWLTFALRNARLGLAGSQADYRANAVSDSRWCYVRSACSSLRAGRVSQPQEDFPTLGLFSPIDCISGQYR